MRTEHAAVYSPFVPIDFAAKEREARQRFQQARARRPVAAPGRAAGGPARREKDFARRTNAARRLRLAMAEF